MEDANITFCGMMLRNARTEAKEAGIKIGKLVTWSTKHGSNKWYEVHCRDNGLVWSGTASCASEAKANYIGGMVEAYYHEANYKNPGEAA